LCALVSTLLFWPVWRRGKNKKKRTARERERAQEIVNDREKPKPTQKSSSLIIRRVPQALEVKNKKEQNVKMKGVRAGLPG
jgi:hypothetical protein